MNANGGMYGEFNFLLEDCDSFDIAADISVFSKPESEFWDSSSDFGVSSDRGIEGEASQLDSFFKNLQEMKDGRDVLIFSSEFDRFPVHSCILAAQSEVLKTQLLSPLTANSSTGNEIRLEFPAEVVSRFIDYMYTGQSDVRGYEDELISLAHLYQMKGLMNLCETSILEKMSESSAVEKLSIAKLYELDVLYSCCLRKIAFNWSQISEDGELMQVFLKDEALLNDVLNCVNELQTAKTSGMLKTKRRRD
jgi:hypothetical protein